MRQHRPDGAVPVARSARPVPRRGRLAGASFVALAVLAALVLPGPGLVGHAGAESSELNAARQRASRAADAFAEAEVELDAAQDRVIRNEADLAAAQLAYDAVAKAVASHLVDEYMRAGIGEIPIVGDDLNTQIRAEALSRLATQRAGDRSDELRRLRQDLDQREAELRRQRKAARDNAAELAGLRTSLFADLQRLEEIEAARAESERQAEIASRQAAAAAASAAAQAAADAAASAEGGSEGARASVPRPVVGADWLCPITGAYAFSDTWGDARAGGRRHRGTDMFADYGTPVVAVVGGEAVDYGWDSAGGNGVFLLGDDGNRYYYAHLDDFGQLGRVSQGDVVGYVGDTGNASGTPHLHFEIHPGGSGWTNPYSTLIQYC